MTEKFYKTVTMYDVNEPGWSFSVIFEVPDKDFNVVEGIKKATHDYLLTEEGHALLDGLTFWNLSVFDEYVPNGFCERYGFSKVFSNAPDEVVYWDENMIDEEEVREEYDVLHTDRKEDAASDETASMV